MKLLHIVSARVWGGGEQYVYNVCKEERRLGNETFILVDEKEDIIAAHYQDVALVLKADLHGLMGLRAVKAVSSLIEDNSIDIVNIHSGNISLLGILLKKKFPQLKFIIFRHNYTKNKTDFYHKWLQKQADAFICVSLFVYKLQIATVQKKYADKIHYVSSGIDLERFPENVVVPRREMSTYVVGYAGRLTENKGLLVLLKALQTVHQKGYDVKLVITGMPEKDFLPILQDEIHKLDMEKMVKITGLKNDINLFYRSLDIFVLPSLVKEAFGLVLCEAMYCHVPVISTDTGAQKEIINNNENGLIVKAGNAVALAEAIIGLLSNKEKREDIAQQGYKTVCDKYTISKCVAGINNIYKSLN